MGVEEFFNAIKERCSTEEVYAAEILKARGFLLEDGVLALSDNVHEQDEAFLKKILQAEKIGEVKNHIITLSFAEKIGNIFDAKYVGGGESFCVSERWKHFVRYNHFPKVWIGILDPFVARYIKALSACRVGTYDSCDGNHPERRGRHRILVACEDGPNELWNAFICQRILSPRFNLRWRRGFSIIGFRETDKWKTYFELNRAGAFLYNNRKLLREIHKQAASAISVSMVRHLPKEELEKIFSDQVNALLSEKCNEFSETDIPFGS